MLDPDILREKPQEVRRMLEKRSVEFDIDGLLAANEARLKDMASCDAIRHERNKIGKMISEAKKSNKDPADLFKKMSEMSEQITKAEEASAESGKKYRRLAFAMPNMLDETVPVGPDESANKLVRKWGSEDIGFEPKNHLDVAAFSNTIDMERAAKTAGCQIFYLRRTGLVVSQSSSHIRMHNFILAWTTVPVQIEDDNSWKRSSSLLENHCLVLMIRKLP